MVLETPLSLKARILRRALHIAFGGIVVYYLFPPTIQNLIPTSLILIVLFVIIPITVEAFRLKFNKLILGLREHERNHVASYVWLAFGGVILILFFPQSIAVPCILATAIGDPVIGETRRFRRRVGFSLGFLTCFIIFLLYGYPWQLAILAGAIAFLAESFELEIHWGLREDLFRSRSRGYVSPYKRFFNFLFKADDDLIMQLIPAISILLLTAVGTGWNIDWLSLPASKLQPLRELELLLTPRS